MNNERRDERRRWEFERRVHNIVELCKDAAGTLRSPDITWGGIAISEQGELSIDDKVTYSAFPLHQEQERVDITAIGKLPLYAIYDIFNSWTVIRGEPAEGGGIFITQYVIIHKEIVGVRHVVFNDGEDSEISIVDFIRGLAKNAEQGIGIGVDTPLPDDEEKLNDALTALGVYQRELFIPHMLERFANQTDEERRAERALKFRVDSNEDYKTKQIQYWIIDTCMGTLYAVRANSPDIAAAIVDEYLEEKTGIGLSFFYSLPLEDEYLEKYDEILGSEIELVPLIPFSREPWPENKDNATPEQLEALERLKPKE